MIEHPFMHPGYGRLLHDQKVLLAYCNPEITKSLQELFVQQGAQVLIWDGVSRMEADVLICGIKDEALLHRTDERVQDLGMRIGNCVQETQEAIGCCIDHMKQQRYGTIVQLGAPYGLYCVPGDTGLAVASEAVAALIRSTAMKYCRYNIRANHLLLPYSLVQSDQDPDLQLLRRAGTLEDVANAALFLASPMSAFLTGDTLPVNGGGFRIGHNQVWQKYLQWI